MTPVSTEEPDPEVVARVRAAISRKPEAIAGRREHGNLRQLVGLLSNPEVGSQAAKTIEWILEHQATHLSEDNLRRLTGLEDPTYKRARDVRNPLTDEWERIYDTYQIADCTRIRQLAVEELARRGEES